MAGVDREGGFKTGVGQHNLVFSVLLAELHDSALTSSDRAC